MPKTKTRVMPDSIKLLRAFDDASGVDCLIEIDGFRYSANVLGDERVQLLGHRKSATRSASERACKQAKRDFSLALEIAVTADWRALNAAMYAEVAS